jgi:hypothetical protein
MLLVKPGQKYTVCCLPVCFCFFARQKIVQGTVGPELKLKKNKRQIVGQSWLIVVRLQVHKFNCIQLLIVLQSAQKQTGRERAGLYVGWELVFRPEPLPGFLIKLNIKN